MILEIIILMICGIIFFISPRIAVLSLAVLASLWIEWTLPELGGIRLGIADVAVISGLLGIIVFVQNRDSFKDIPFRWLIFLYIFLSVLALFLSPVEVFEQAEKIIWSPYKEIYITLLFFLFFIILKDKKIIQQTVTLLLISSGFASIIGIIQAVLRTPFYLGIGTYGERMSEIASDIFADMTLRVFGTLWHPNSFATFLIWPLSISVSIFLLDKQYKYKKILVFLILLQVIALVLTQSRGGWMGFLLSTVIIFFYTGVYKKGYVIVIVLLSLIMMIALQGIFPQMDLIPGDISKRFFSVGNVKEDAAMSPRYKRWEYFYNMSLERPLTGFGVIATKEVLEHFQDYAVSPHNTYLSIAVKRGYIALAIIFIILFKFAKFSNKVFKSAEDNYMKALGLGIFSGLLGLFCVSAFFDSFLQEKQTDILFWLLLSITLRAVDLQNKKSKEHQQFADVRII